MIKLESMDLVDVTVHLLHVFKSKS